MIYLIPNDHQESNTYMKSTILCVALIVLIPNCLRADTNPLVLQNIFGFSPNSDSSARKVTSFEFASTNADNTVFGNSLDEYLRFSIGVGRGQSDISPDEENIYHNDSGIGFSARLALEKPIMPLVSINTGWNILVVSHINLFEDSTTSLGMSLTAGFSIGRRDVPGNFHVSAATGYGFAGVGDDESDDRACITFLCADTAKGGTGLGRAYRLSAGYTAQNGTLFELVAQRMGGEGDNIPDGKQAHLSSMMIVLTSGL